MLDSVKTTNLLSKNPIKNVQMEDKNKAALCDLKTKKPMVTISLVKI